MSRRRRRWTGQATEAAAAADGKHGKFVIRLLNTSGQPALGSLENRPLRQRLQDLLVQPSNAKNWHGPYLDKLPTDPWGNPYIYYYPGKHSANSYDLLSPGPDSKEGTDDDIVSWAK